MIYKLEPATAAMAILCAYLIRYVLFKVTDMNYQQVQTSFIIRLRD